MKTVACFWFFSQSNSWWTVVVRQRQKGWSDAAGRGIETRPQGEVRCIGGSQTPAATLTSWMQPPTHELLRHLDHNRQVLCEAPHASRPTESWTGFLAARLNIEGQRRRQGATKQPAW